MSEGITQTFPKRRSMSWGFGNLPPKKYLKHRYFRSKHRYFRSKYSKHRLCFTNTLPRVTLVTYNFRLCRWTLLNFFDDSISCHNSANIWPLITLLTALEAGNDDLTHQQLADTMILYLPFVRHIRRCRVDIS